MVGIDHSGAKSVTPGGSVAGHTPGPWEASFSFPGRDGIGDVWQIDADGHAVCTTQFCYAPYTEANARLIAAARELLAVAIKSHEPYEGLSESDIRTLYGVEEAELALSLRAAIAKATAGETRNAEGAL